MFKLGDTLGRIKYYLSKRNKVKTENLIIAFYLKYKNVLKYGKLQSSKRTASSSLFTTFTILRLLHTPLPIPNSDSFPISFQSFFYIKYFLSI